MVAMPSGRGYWPVLLISSLAAVIGCCNGQSVAITPSQAEVIPLEYVGGTVPYSPQWFNVTCVENGFTAGMVNWTRNQMDIAESDGHVIDGNQLYFRVHHLHSTAQEIECAVEDAASDVVYRARVSFTSVERPPAAASVSTSEVFSTSAKLTVHAAQLRNANELHVRYVPKSGGPMQTMKYSAITASYKVQLTGLTPNTGYVANFTYANSVSSVMGTSISKSFTTKAVPTVPSIGQIRVTHVSAVVSLGAPGMWNDDQVADGRKYRVTVRLNTVQRFNPTTAGTPTQIRVPDLSAGSTYEVTVVAISQYGESLEATKTFTTLVAPVVTLRGEIAGRASELTTFPYIFNASAPAAWRGVDSLSIRLNYSLDGNVTFMSTNLAVDVGFPVDIGGEKDVYVVATPVVNNITYPEYSGTYTTKTFIRSPFPVKFNVSPGAYELSISWEPIDFNTASKATSLTVQIIGGNRLPVTTSLTGTELFFNSTARPNTNYQIKLTVSGHDISKPVIQQRDITTLEAAPDTEPAIASVVPAGTGITVSWNMFSEWNSDGDKVDGDSGVYLRYILSWTNGTGGNNVSLGSSERSYTISDLIPFTNYSVSLAAMNEHGVGPAARSSAVTSQREPGRVRRVNVTQSNYSTAEVTWMPPKTANGVLRDYSVTIVDSRGQSQTKTTPMQTAVFYNLRGGERYNVSVKARTVAFGKPRYYLFNSTVGVPSSAPTLMVVELEGVVEPQLNLTWTNPLETHGTVVSYTVYYTADGAGTEENVVIPPNAVCSTCIQNRLVATLKGLLYDTRYTVAITVQTSAGSSPRSASFRKQTLLGIPLAPRNLTYSMVTSSSVALEWLPPVDTSFSREWGYDVKYGQSSDFTTNNEITKKVTSTETGDEVVDTVLDNLLPYRKYIIQVQTTTRRDSSSKTQISVTTDAAEPEKPEYISHACPSTREDILPFSWGKPVNLNGPEVRYRVSVNTTAVVSDDYLGMEGADNLERHTWSPSKPLQPFTRYRFSIRAFQEHDPALISDYLVEEVECKSSSYEPRPPKVVPKFPANSKIASNGSLAIVLSPSPDDAFVSHYIVYVEQSTGSEATRKRRDVGDRFRRQADATSYPTARLTAASPSRTFVVGDNQVYGNIHNPPLTRGYDYRFSLVSVTPSGKESSRQWSTPLNFAAGQDESGSNLTLIVAAVAGGAIVLSLVLLLIIVLVRYHGRKRNNGSSTTAKSGGSGKKPFDPVIEPQGETLEKLRTSGSVEHPPVRLADFARHIALLKDEGAIAFSEEYASVPLHFEGFTTNNSDLTVNHLKNRYTNIKAYDHSRVRLNAIRGVSGSDYINANFIDGHNEKNAYIATQGPVDETKADFWRMVWEQLSATIVMLTNLEEKGKPKCSQYWPDSGTVAYGNIEVTLTDTIPLADYVVRVFNLVKIGRDEPAREVKQFQFTAWPDQSAPRHATPMLLFRRKVRQLNPERSGPMIVHCSAGIGRTGTFIAIDAMLKRAEEEDTLDVFGYCTIMRAQRNFMVQVEEQYVFIHDSLKESLECGNTEIFAKDLPQALQRLRQPSLLEDSVTGLEAEFQRLSSQKVDDLSFLAALRDCNVKKNRFVDEMYLPFDEYRVRLPLSSMMGEEGGDYVNGSFVDGYKSHCAFVAAQSPMAHTVDAFWQMVWQSGSKVIVMLTDVTENGQDTCHQYWPVDMAAQYGTCLVDPISEQTKTDSSQQVVYNLRQFKMTTVAGDATRTVCLFQYTGTSCWPDETGSSSDMSSIATGRRSLIDLIGEVQKLQERTDDHSPVVVHCDTGVGRTGCFIALSTIIERMRCEGLLDVFMTVKSIREHRPFLVRTVAEYSFVYDTVLEYLSPFDHFTDVMDTDGELAMHSRHSVDVAV